MPPRTIWAWSVCLETSSPPDPSGTGGGSRMPAVNGVGEPCAGEPHARVEVAGVGNGDDPDHGHWGGTNDRETGGDLKAPGPTAGEGPRQLPTLPRGQGW